MRKQDSDTICAIATPRGDGGIAVLRLSGSNALNIGRKCCRFLPEDIESHRVYFGNFRKPKDGEILDEVLVTYFAKGRSFTGDETLEISCHGGEFLSGELLSELVLAGARLAEPGEFTYRAFMNGRLNLPQAESVLELIQSRSARAAASALKNLKGEFSRAVTEVEDQLLWILANSEANIDFAAEDIEVASTEQIVSALKNVRESIDQLIAGYKQGKFLKEGLHVAILGPPNVGKSSLLNAILKEEKAIVTDRPGTTRDEVEGRKHINGVEVLFTDTAGLRETDDQVERLGIAKSLRRLSNSDLVLWVVDLSLDGDFYNFGAVGEIPKDRVVIVGNKVDCVHDWKSLEGFYNQCRERGWKAIAISAMEGTGLKDLESHLSEMLADQLHDKGSRTGLVRHYELLLKAKSAVVAGLNQLEQDSSPEFLVFEVQSALTSIQEILGKRFDDEVLDRVFKEFCLGK